jgi:ABC-type protease/lipase transport system fused ATPase/permease subunit
MSVLLAVLAQLASHDAPQTTTGDIVMRVLVAAMGVLLGSAVGALIRLFGAFRALSATMEANESARSERESARKEEANRMHEENKEKIAALHAWQESHMEWAENQKQRLYQDLVAKATFDATIAGFHGALGHVGGQIAEVKTQLGELLKERR